MRFLAVAVDGVSVIDGVLGRDSDGVFIRTVGKRYPVANPPSSFQQLIGARIWLAGPLDTGPYKYGMIIPATP
jgi:hypothetical protein